MNFDDLFLNYNWTVYENGVLKVDDPKKYLLDYHRDIFVEQVTKNINTKHFEFICEDQRHRIVAILSIFPKVSKLIIKE